MYDRTKYRLLSKCSSMAEIFIIGLLMNGEVTEAIDLAQASCISPKRFGKLARIAYE